MRDYHVLQEIFSRILVWFFGLFFFTALWSIFLCWWFFGRNILALINIRRRKIFNQFTFSYLEFDQLYILLRIICCEYHKLRKIVKLYTINQIITKRQSSPQIAIFIYYPPPPSENTHAKTPGVNRGEGSVPGQYFK